MWQKKKRKKNKQGKKKVMRDMCPQRVSGTFWERLIPEGVK